MKGKTEFDAIWLGLRAQNKEVNILPFVPHGWMSNLGAAPHGLNCFLDLFPRQVELQALNSPHGL